MQDLERIIEKHLRNVDFKKLVREPLTNIFAGSLHELTVANTAKDKVIAANNYSPQGIMRSIGQLISSLETWATDKHNSIITEVSTSNNISPSKWLIKQSKSNWLSNGVKEEKRYVEISVNQLDRAYVAFARYAYDASGFSGMLKGLARGFTDPNASAKVNNEIIELQTAWQKSMQKKEESFWGLEQQIQNSIERMFADETSTAIQEIKYLLERERQRKIAEEQERQRKIAEEREQQKKIAEEQRVRKKKRRILITIGLILVIMIFLSIIILNK